MGATYLPPYVILVSTVASAYLSHSGSQASSFFRIHLVSLWPSFVSSAKNVRTHRGIKMIPRSIAIVHSPSIMFIVFFSSTHCIQLPRYIPPYCPTYTGCKVKDYRRTHACVSIRLAPRPLLLAQFQSSSIISLLQVLLQSCDTAPLLHVPVQVKYYRFVAIY